MADSNVCSVCVRAQELGVTPDTSKSKAHWAETLGVNERSVRRHFKHGPEPRLGNAKSGSADSASGYSFVRDSDSVELNTPKTERPQTEEDADQIFRAKGLNPDDYDLDYRFGEWEVQTKGGGTTILYSQRVYGRKKAVGAGADGPAWQPVQTAQPVTVAVTAPTYTPTPLVGTWKTAVANADHQIGYRADQPFHDDAAMAISSQIIGIEQPDQIIYCGDFLDLAAQGRYEQEAAFAGTTQRAIDRGHEYLAVDRALAPKAEMILIEGNHDRRMEKFIVNNAMAAYGLKKANQPESWPVMSIPNLLRLDEVDVRYIDAYPAGAWWINDRLRAIHGDKVKSGGSTASAYTNHTPHISTIFGHTHRAEIQSRTTFGERNKKIRTMSINPGCMCRIDGEVPGFHSSTGIDGKAATRWEDWQNGLVVIRYKDSGEFFANLVQIEDGVTVYDNQEIRG